MNSRELLTFPTPNELARAAAGDWLAECQDAGRAGRPFRVALSGGRIARLFFQAAAELARGRQPIDWNQVHFFWADERCVPPQDPESNFALADTGLFRPLQIPAANIHRIRGEAPPAQAAREAAEELRRVAPPDQSGHPVLDLILLGMGEDGHVASLFPGPENADLPDSDTELYRAVTAPKPPPHRITLTYPVIYAARQVWVLASGPGKERALADSLEGWRHNERRVEGMEALPPPSLSSQLSTLNSPQKTTPLGQVLQIRSRARLYTDIRPQ